MYIDSSSAQHVICTLTANLLNMSYVHADLLYLSYVHDRSPVLSVIYLFATCFRSSSDPTLFLVTPYDPESLVTSFDALDLFSDQESALQVGYFTICITCQ